MLRDEIYTFLKSLKGKFEGCTYKCIDHDNNIYIIACYDFHERAYMVKLGRNVDDLQSDYTFDWSSLGNFEFLVYPRKTDRKETAKDIALEYWGVVGA